MKKYRISKYNSLYRNADGVYEKDEWTSCSDIGKTYEGKVFTSEEYLKTENNYLRTMVEIMEICEINELVIMSLEKSLSVERLKEEFKRSSLILSLNEIEYYMTLNDGISVCKAEFPIIMPLLLRECFWCELSSSILKFYVGYDFYLHLECDLEFALIQDIASRFDLFAEVTF